MPQILSAAKQGATLNDKVIHFLVCIIIGILVSALSDAIIKTIRKQKYKNQLIKETKAVKPYVGDLKEGIVWYPSGWTYHLKTQKWAPPPETQINRPLTFEEWKTEKEKEKQAKHNEIN